MLSKYNHFYAVIITNSGFIINGISPFFKTEFDMQSLAIFSNQLCLEKEPAIVRNVRPLTLTYLAFILQVLQIGKQFVTANSLFIAFILQVLQIGKQFVTANSLFNINISYIKTNIEYLNHSYKKQSLVSWRC